MAAYRFLESVPRCLQLIVLTFVGWTVMFQLL